MKQKNLFLISCALAAVLAFSSCAENTNGGTDSAALANSADAAVPDESKGETPSEAAGPDTVTLSELAESKDKYIADLYAQTYGNFIFAENIDIKIPEEIGTYKVKERGDLAEYKDKIFEKYVPEGVYDKSKVTYNDEETYGKNFGWSFLDDETGVVVTVGNSGFMNHINNKSQALYEMDYSALTRSVYVGSDFDDESLKMINGEAKISELVAAAEKELEEYAETVDSQLGFTPRWLDIYTDPESKKQYCIISFSEDYKDVQLAYSLNGSFSSGIEKNFFNLFEASVMYTRGENSEGFVVQNDLGDAQTLDTQDKILSPAAAARIASEKLSGYRKYNVANVALTYLPITDMPEDSRTLLSMTLTPYWHFVITDENGGSGYTEKAVYVNCYNGEIETIL